MGQLILASNNLELPLDNPISVVILSFYFLERCPKFSFSIFIYSEFKRLYQYFWLTMYNINNLPLIFTDCWFFYILLNTIIICRVICDRHGTDSSVSLCDTYRNSVWHLTCQNIKVWHLITYHEYYSSFLRLAYV